MDAEEMEKDVIVMLATIRRRRHKLKTYCGWQTKELAPRQSQAKQEHLGGMSLV